MFFQRHPIFSQKRFLRRRATTKFQRGPPVCVDSLKRHKTSYLFGFCRQSRWPGTDVCLSWPTKTRQHEGESVPAVQCLVVLLVFFFKLLLPTHENGIVHADDKAPSARNFPILVCVCVYVRVCVHMMETRAPGRLLAASIYNIACSYLCC